MSIKCKFHHFLTLTHIYVSASLISNSCRESTVVHGINLETLNDEGALSYIHVWIKWGEDAKFQVIMA